MIGTRTSSGRVRGTAGVPLVVLALTLAAGGCVRTRPVDPAVLGGLAETSVVLAADGSELTTLLAEQDRRPLALHEIPLQLREAVLAVEDRRFYQHSGVDLRGVARAAAADVRAGRAEQGGSTITQQLVKNTLVTPEPTLRRKVKEAALAMGLERSLSKDQILERYLNTVYFGQGSYGVGAAVRVYFGHGPERLSLPEAALLAGLIRSPVRADPLRDRAAAGERRSQVLAAMVQTGAITEREAAVARRAPLPRRAHRDHARHPAGHAVQEAVTELLADPRLGPDPAARRNALFRGGLRITLTIDPAAQREAERAVSAVLTDPARDPAAAVAAVRPGDGAITAMVGGRDFFSVRDPQAKVNLARGGSTKRQAGSTFKVFALLAALEAGVRPEDSFAAGARVTLPRRFAPPWEVDNNEGDAFGRVSLRQATEDSVNTAYARVVQRIGGGDVDRGAAAVVAVAERLGVRGAGERPLRREPAVTLGAQEVDPVQMAAAYAAIGAGGVYARPYLVASVTDRSGRVILENAPAPRRVLAEGVAATAADVLAGVVRRGTGVRAALPRPMAGKTGTSTGYHDAWFVGFTPNLAAAVWLGVPSRQRSLTPDNGFRTVIAGGTYPASIWARFAGSTLLGQAALPLPRVTEPTVRVAVDTTRGCLPNQWTPPWLVGDRSYLRGTEPTVRCAEPAGPPATVVPALLGLSGELAAARLEAASFRLAVQEVFDPNYPPGVVVGQQPASGTPVSPGATVTLRVSAGRRGAVVVPDVLGLDVDAARRQLTAAGLGVVVSVEPSCTGPDCALALARDAGRVWRQDIAAGTRLSAGIPVGIAVGPSAAG